MAITKIVPHKIKTKTLAKYVNVFVQWGHIVAIGYGGPLINNNNNAL